MLLAMRAIMQILAPLNSDPRPALQRIETASSFQIPGLHIIGLPAPEVSEARERIRAAMESSGFELPKRRVVLNLAPASIRKRGTGLDLAMALGLLSLNLPERCEEKIAAWGELGLDGSVQAAGQLARAIYSSWQGGISKLFISREEAATASQILKLIETAGIFKCEPPKIIPVSNLRELWERFRATEISDSDASNGLLAPSLTSDNPDEPVDRALLPLSPGIERFICIAALGGHHVLLLGPKGTGKSQALEWLVALQPENSARSKIHHLLLLELYQSRTKYELSAPVRRISSGVRASALVGSCSSGAVRPGEFSLAHGGLLIADEFPEWSRDSREALREPLEKGIITVTRSKTSIEFPAQFALAANGNLCPCGGWPSEFPVPIEQNQERAKVPSCRCSHSARKHYIDRLSGPILDRLDVVLLVAQGSSRDQTRKKSSDLRSVQNLKNRVRECRDQALKNWGAPPGTLSPTTLETILDNHPSWRNQLDQLQLTSLRSRHKVLRVALSLAVWDGIREPRTAHFLEASCYRPERFGLCE